MKNYLGVLLLLVLPFAPTALAQSNVRAHYANGQVWVVWGVQDAVVSNCVPPTNTATPYGANIRYLNCAGTTEVVLIRIDGMPHLWPDAADGHGFDANVSVIDFLLRHTRP